VNIINYYSLLISIQLCGNFSDALLLSLRETKFLIVLKDNIHKGDAFMS